jgi:futalosine hydrolase
MELLVCTATDLEGASLRGWLSGGRLARGTIAGREVALLRTGVGPVSAAHALTLVLATERVEAVLGCGIGGAYPGSKLELLDIACAASETYGDLGALAPQGFLDMERLGFPTVDREPPLYNRLPVPILPLDRRLPFVTVSCCSGTPEAARDMERRTGGALESMEGAALAQVALLHDVPFGEIRAVSNLAGEREGWRAREAAERAQGALLQWLEER